MDELKALADQFPPSDELPEPLVAEQRRKLMAFIDEDNQTSGMPDGEPTPPPRRRPNRRRVAALVAVPAAVMLVAAATWVATRSSAAEAYSFSCVTQGVVSVMPNYGTSPIDECAGLWESGGMDPHVTTAPPLVACIDRASSVMVIEGDGSDACRSAGMSTWEDQPAYEKAGAAVREVLISMHDRAAATGDRCMSVDDWRDGLASQPDIAGWNLTVNQIDSSRHCYDLESIDPVSETITVVGAASDASLGCDPRTGC